VVDYDGENLMVKTSGLPVPKVVRVKDIADLSRYPSTYVQGEGTWYIRGTRKNARALYELGLGFTPRAAIFVRNRPKPEKPREYDFSILSKELFPFQKEGVRWLGTSGNKLLGDEMGLGKTVQVAALLRYRPDLLPALIVCPASLKINWQREIEALADIKAQILYGRQSHEIAGLLERYPVVIANYDILGAEDQRARKDEERRVKTLKAIGMPYRKKSLPVSGWCDTLAALPLNLIVCDEVQLIAEAKNIRTRAVMQVSRARPRAKRVFLSGTPYENRTSQFFTCLNLLAPRTFPNRWRYQMTFCDPKKGYYGWRFDGLSNGEQLHGLVRPLMLRRLKKDVLKQLPPKQKFVVPMELSERKLAAYNVAEKAFDASLDGKKQVSFTAMKKAAYDLKRDAAIQWIRDYLSLAENKKLVVFFWHRNVLEDLRDEFGHCSVSVSGDNTPAQRQKAVDAFQADPRVFLFLGQLEAAGVGLTLTAAPAVCFVEFGESAGQHTQGEDRVHRISQDADSVFAYYLVAPGTIEDDIMSTLTERSRNQKMVLDGEKDARFFEGQLEDFRAGVLAAYRKRRRGQS